MVKGYNALCGTRVKLGSWADYLAMRAGILQLNDANRALLSNDLGALAGLLFDIGSGRYQAPPRDDDEAARAAWEIDLARVRTDMTKIKKSADEDRTHTEIQGWLRDLGRALGFDIWIAANDRTRPLGAGLLGDRCLEVLPADLATAPGADAIRMIDVLWLEPPSGRVTAAFEVEHTTSIYSGIIRLLDLALGASAHATRGLFLVAPDDREDEVRAQLARPAFQRVSDLNVRYLPYGELERNRDAMARFGSGLKAIEAVARTLA
jgi:type II restriction enzyme